MIHPELWFPTVQGLNGEQVSEADGTGSWVHTNVFSSGALLATYSQTDTDFALTDWLGTKRAQYTAGGVLTTFASPPYGDNLTQTGPGPDATEHHFTGKERDQESGLDYFGARYYPSTMGRFISPDPIMANGLRMINPQRWNMYAYAVNSPLVNIEFSIAPELARSIFRPHSDSRVAVC